MINKRWHAEASRKITGRIVLECDLVLETPTHFGNGDASEMTDLPVAADFYDGKTPVLTGASIAGALRSYLVAREKGFLVSEKAKEKSYTTSLFGGSKGDDSGKQSPLIIEDAFGYVEPGKSFAIETREGVKIESKSRTAANDMLYSRQLWEAGTTFKLRFELLLGENTEENENRKRALATALAGFSDGSITLGARKRRGYGRVSAQNWRAHTFDLKSKNGLLDWLRQGSSSLTNEPFSDPATALGVTLLSEDQRREFRLDAEFTLDGSMLIRGSGAEDVGPDMQHLHSKRKGNPVPIISGTSLAGALRARAEKIANTITQKKKEHESKVRELVEGMFGSDNAANGHPRASRLIVSESEIEAATNDLVQSRVSIDRFTGGALDTALFTEAPVFKTAETRIRINLRLQNPEEPEIGLLLLLLKDLWTSDLAIGGEVSVGRGRLRGKMANLTLHQTWSIAQNGDKLAITPENGAESLQVYVKSLNDYLLGKEKTK